MMFLYQFFMFWMASIVGTVVIAGQKRLSLVGYFFIALFLGPFAIIIVLLSRSNVPSQENQETFTLQSAKQHLFDLKRNLKYLTEKYELLEAQISKLSGNEKAPPKKLKPSQPAAKQGLAASVQKQAVQPVDIPQSESFELTFGKVWLSRIGVVIFVLGIGFFISYTFQYFNAAAKIGIGYLFSAAFFVWGHYLEKTKKYAKVALGILGGAWGLLYLSTYAMHYIDATQIIYNSAIEIILLAAVSIAAVARNLKYKSWVVTAITFILAYITASLGGINYSSILYYSLLSGSIAYLSYKRQWHPFFIPASAHPANFKKAQKCKKPGI